MSQSAGRATWGVLAFIAIASTIISLNPVRQVTGADNGTGYPCSGLNAGAPCDLYACVNGETCANNSGPYLVCQGGWPNNATCDDGNICTIDICAPSYQTAPSGCEYEDAPNGTVCDSGYIKCVTGGATCQAGVCTNATDTDGDTICDESDPDPLRLDPSGYFYDEQSAHIIPGGHVGVTCAPGSATLTELLDGSSGQYLYVVSNITDPERCTLEITVPRGCALSETCLPSLNTFEAPSIPPAFVALGNYPVDPTHLSSAACTPWYKFFRFESGDADVINNNIPVRCPDVKAPTVSKWGLGAMALLLMAAAFVLLRRQSRQA